MEFSLVNFNGERVDPLSKRYHPGNGYRSYNPRLRRFITPDCWSPFGSGGINPYAYCKGDPINRADPTGHMSLGRWVGLATGLVAGVLLSIATDGGALPAVVSLMATLTGDAAIGAGAEMLAEAVDGQQVNWQQVGIAAGISAAAVLGGYGLGRVSRLKGIRKQPFRGLMMGDEGQVATEVTSTGSGNTAGVASGGHESPNTVYSRIYDYVTGLSTARRVNTQSAVGQGVSGVVVKDSEGYLRKNFHGLALLYEELIPRELSIFRRVYGVESAELIGPDQTSMRMWEIPGKPLNTPNLLLALTDEDRARLYDTVSNLHSQGIYHGDLHKGNILFDSVNRRFHLIDFGLSRLTSDENLLNREKNKLLESMAGWPAN